MANNPKHGDEAVVSQTNALGGNKLVFSRPVQAFFDDLGNLDLTSTADIIQHLAIIDGQVNKVAPQISRLDKAVENSQQLIAVLTGLSSKLASQLNALPKHVSGTFSTNDEDDSFLTVVFIAGDTSATLGLVDLTCQRTGSTAAVSGRMFVADLNLVLPTTNRIQWTYDLERRALQEGWFSTITSISTGAANINYRSSLGNDQPWQSIGVSGNSGGLTFFANESLGSGTSSSLQARFSVVLNVSD